MLQNITTDHCPAKQGGIEKLLSVATENSYFICTDNSVRPHIAPTRTPRHLPRHPAPAWMCIPQPEGPFNQKVLGRRHRHDNSVARCIKKLNSSSESRAVVVWLCVSVCVCVCVSRGLWCWAISWGKITLLIFHERRKNKNKISKNTLSLWNTLTHTNAHTHTHSHTRTLK